MTNPFEFYSKIEVVRLGDTIAPAKWNVRLGGCNRLQTAGCILPQVSPASATKDLESVKPPNASADGPTGGGEALQGGLFSKVLYRCTPYSAARARACAFLGWSCSHQHSTG